jgi:hypothetical protein
MDFDEEAFMICRLKFTRSEACLDVADRSRVKLLGSSHRTFLMDE